MYRVWREGDVAHLALFRIELVIVRQVIGDVVDRLRLEEEVALDPFALWERDFTDEVSTLTDLDDRDPLLDRLFPAVLPHDEQASAEHRRFSEDDLRRQKAREGDLVLEELERAFAAQPLPAPGADEPVFDVHVPLTVLDAWLRTLNATRLALALDLDITTQGDVEQLEGMAEDDERAYPYAVYEFLAEIQAVLLELA